MTSGTATEAFAALLRGAKTPFSAFGLTPEAFLRRCREEDLTGLTYERVRTAQNDCDWPRTVYEPLAEETRTQTARELVRQRELLTVLDLLATDGICPIVLKGTALAYSLYENPASRPRADTDLLIRRNQVDAVSRAMARIGYSAPAYCDGELLFGQFPLTKTDRFGLVHTFDFHWRISTQTVFADLLAFDEIAAEAAALPALGGHSRTAGPLHALLLACVHPVMHHRNVESLLWIYDIHLLASRLSDREFDRFVQLAVSKRVSAICAHQLTAARNRCGTRIPGQVLARLADVPPDEPSAAYLRPDRRWHDELISNMRGLPRWSDRLRLLREVMLPAPAYMLRSHGLAASSRSAVLLPLLYLRRLASGSWKVLAGQK